MEWYARVPRSVTLDQRLKGNDFRVYAALALHERFGFVSMGARRIGVLLKISKSAVCVAINHLVGLGHVQKAELKRGRRQRLRLTDKVFHCRKKKESSTVEQARKFADQDQDATLDILLGMKRKETVN